MAILSRRIRSLRWLLGLPGGSSARVAALAAALAVAEGPEAEAFATELVEIAYAERRPARPALHALMTQWARVSPAARAAALLIGESAWSGVVREAVHSADPAHRRAAAEVIGAVPLPELAGDLPGLLGDTDMTVGDAAQRALEELVRLAVGRPSKSRQSAADLPVFTPEQRHAFDQALARAIDLYGQHRRPRVLLAAARLVAWAGPFAGAARGSALRAILADEAHPAHLVIRGLLRRAPDAAIHAAAWTWLPYPALTAACAERLATIDATTPAAAASSATPAAPVPTASAIPERVLAAFHLAAHPARAAAFARFSRSTPAPIFPSCEAISAMSETARIGFAKWVAAVPAPLRVKDAALAGFLTDPSPRVRHAAVRAAIALPLRPSCLLDFCFDADPRIARTATSALLAVSRRDAISSGEETRLSTILSRATSPDTRALAHALLHRPGRFVSAAEIRHHLDTLRAAIAGADAPDATDPAVTDAAPTPGATARAAAALASLPGPDADAALHACAHNVIIEPRIRANAVDALAHRLRRAAGSREAGEAASALAALASDDAHRVRASAARALVVAGQRLGGRAGDAWQRAGCSTLSAMLSDPRPAHRVAGLWLAERLGPLAASIPGVVERVAYLARRAPDPAEQARASRTAQRLAIEIRAGWSRRVRNITPAAASSAASSSRGEAAA